MFLSPVKSYALQHYMHEYVHFPEIGLASNLPPLPVEEVLERPTFLFSENSVVVGAAAHLS
jgi:hypothetical protein